MSEERAVLAGGCFWGMQDLFRRYDGVVSTRVGYTGGDVPNATYRNHGSHAEAIEIIFDPAKMSYRRRRDRRCRCFGVVASQGGDRGFSSRRLLGSRARSPELPRALSRRLYLS